MKDKYLDQYGIDSMVGLKEAIKCGATHFLTRNETMLEDKEELEKEFNIKITSPKEMKNGEFRKDKYSQ